MSNYYGLRLKTGEVLFSEIKGIDHENRHILEFPIHVIETPDETGITVKLMPFAAYSLSTEHRIGVGDSFMVDLLSPRCVNMYGSAVSHHAFTRIKEEVTETLSGDIIADYPVLMNMLTRLRTCAEYYKTKFPNIEVSDFKDMEEAINKNKPSFH